MTKRGLAVYEIEEKEEEQLTPAHFEALDAKADWWMLMQFWDSEKTIQDGYKITVQKRDGIRSKTGDVRGSTVVTTINAALKLLDSF